MGWVGKTERGGEKEKGKEKKEKTKTKTLRLLPSVARRMLSPPSTFFLFLFFVGRLYFNVILIHCTGSGVMLVSSQGPGFQG